MNPRAEESELSVAKQCLNSFGRHENYHKNSARVALAVAYWKESQRFFSVNPHSFRGWLSAYLASSWALEAVSVASVLYDKEHPVTGREGIIMAPDQIDAIIDIVSAPWYLGGDRTLAERLFGARRMHGFFFEFQ